MKRVVCPRKVFLPQEAFMGEAYAKVKGAVDVTRGGFGFASETRNGNPYVHVARMWPNMYSKL